MMDIKIRLTRCCGKPVGGYKCSDGIRCPDCFDKLEGWREIERLRNVVENWRELVGAKVFNEEIIKMKNEEIERLREVLHEIYRKCDNDRIMWMIDDALQQKDTE